MAREGRKLLSRIVVAIGFLLAGAFVLGWCMVVMPEAFHVAQSIHYPIKFLGIALLVGALIGAGILWPFEWAGDHIDPDAHRDKRARK